MKTALLAIALITASNVHPTNATQRHLAPLAARVTAFAHSLHYEGHGEWNCRPAVCNRQLRRYHLTWALVSAELHRKK